MLTEKDVAALGELDSALKMAKSQVFGLSVQVASATAGPMTDFLETIRPIVGKVVEWVKENPELVKTVGAITFAVAGTSAAAVALGSAMVAVAASSLVVPIAALVGAFGALEGVMRTINELFGTTLTRLDMIGKALDSIPQLAALRNIGAVWWHSQVQPMNTTAPIAGLDATQAAAMQANAMAGTAAMQASSPAVTMTADAVAKGLSAAGVGGPVEIIGFDKLLSIESDILRAVRGGPVFE